MLKPALTTSQHIALLRQRGMVVDSAQAEQWLNSVGYYRLSAYWYPARQVDPSPTGRRLDQFVPGTDFANVAELYEADRKLRTLVHDGMERIEVAVRTQVVEILCAQHPSNPAFYLSSDSFRTKFAHLQWLQTAYRRLARAGSPALNPEINEQLRKTWISSSTSMSLVTTRSHRSKRVTLSQAG